MMADYMPASEYDLFKRASAAWGLDADTLAAWNDDAANLREMLAAQTPAPVADAGPQLDRAEELREKWDVQPGDLWALGEHRLICGDCTDAAVVARVMGVATLLGRP